jgi:isopenicillin N synthase-like dioxygenase
MVLVTTFLSLSSVLLYLQYTTLIMEEESPIPIIDINSDTVVSDIKNACEEVGFFFLKNHGIDNLREVFEQSKQFFQLPVEEKMQCLHNKGNLGYTSYQDEILAPSLQSCGDTKEGYYIGRQMEPDEADYDLYQNVWPQGSNGENWRRVMSKYHDDCCTLGARLLSIMSLALGLEPDFFVPMMQRPTALARLLRYGRTPSDLSTGVYGCGPHSDYGMITLLATNEVSGLQILLKNQWLQVPPHPEMFVVNIGDCLQRITNDHFRSTVHRVIMGPHNGVDRYSIAFFYEPNRQAEVRSLDSFASDESSPAGPKYAPVLYGDYLNQKYAATTTAAYGK